MLPFKDFLTFAELDRGLLEELLKLSAAIKASPASYASALRGKTVAQIFKKPSTRTRISFSAGTNQLGGYPLDLPADTMQWKRGETLEDTAKTISLYCDAIVIRTFEQKEVEELARCANISVINALTDSYHPCQILADLLTVAEVRGSLPGLKLAYIGDGNNVANTLALGCAISGMDFAIAAPAGYEMDREAVRLARSLGEARITESGDPFEAVSGADILYTDVWVSMGQEDEEDEKTGIFRPYQINQELLSRAKADAAVMHCLPAHRGEEITAEVLDGPQSIVWQQAENRLHAQKALMVSLLENRG